MLIIIFLLIFQVVDTVKFCQTNVCLNGGICEVDEVERSFKCICPRGFAGTLCELNCTLDCKNGGKCFIESHKEICRCPKDFTGDLCEVGTIDCLVQGCAPNERCVKRPSGSAICIEDECKPNPCLNSGTCLIQNDKLKCNCTIGIKGERCELDIDECLSNPCKNEAECINLFGSFFCKCTDFFTGKLCEEPNFCSMDPCLNGGTCKEAGNGYECICPPTFTGENCQDQLSRSCNCSDELHSCVDGECICPNGTKKKICDRKIDEVCSCNNEGICKNGSMKCECKPGFYGQHCELKKPCNIHGLNCVHGKCAWTLKGAVCICDPNYTGVLCESHVPNNVCDGYNCNSGKCRDEDGRAVCECPSNTSGDFCEIEHSCPADYCLNEGHCIYNTTDDSSLSCTCKNAFVGLRCEFYLQEPSCENKCADSEICLADSSGSACQTVTSECSECENLLHCLKHKNGSICICNLGWTGPRCSQKIKGCEMLDCKSPRICRQTTNQYGKVSFCGCTPGLNGPNCWNSTAATFHSHSYFLHQISNLIDGSRNTMSSLSFSFRTTVSDTRMMVAENILGQIQFSIGLHFSHLFLNFPGNFVYEVEELSFNNDRWFTLTIINAKKEISIEVSEADRSFYKRTVSIKKELGIFLIRFGRTREEGFKGCIRDVKINDKNLDLTSPEFCALRQSFGIIEGCQRTKQCFPNPCQNRGICIDNWDSFTCNCMRPFLPPYCMNRLDEVTFAHQNQSSLIEIDASVNSDDIKHKTDISFIARTNRPDAALFYIGEKGFDDIGTFISMELVDGKVGVKSRLGGKNVISKKFIQRINDNEEHLIHLNRIGNNFTVTIDDDLSDGFVISNRFEHPLLADTLMIGNRQDVRAEAFDSDKDFKGSLSDFRINDMIVAWESDFSDMENKRFGVITNMINVLNGTVSDDVCSQMNSCLHGACENTFNDYKCVCETSWMGKNCDTKDFCLLSPCKSNATCTNAHGGYICTQPASFYPSSSVILNRRNGTHSMEVRNSISFSIRTRSTSGQILHMNAGDDSLSIFIKDNKLALQTNTVDNTLNSINDGRWHSINISHSMITIDKHEEIIPEESRIELTKLLNSFNSTLIIGKRDGQQPSFQGCVDNVTIGSHPTISFLDEKNVGAVPKEFTQFFIVERINIRNDGCISENICHLMNPCKNSATCRDDWNRHFCECPPGFSGQLCEKNIDDCRDNKCVNGNCIDEINKYSCICDPDFSGKFCDRRIDYCNQTTCLNGGTCESLNGTFNCACPPAYVGSRCQVELSSKCEQNPCENSGRCKEKEKSFSCKCPPDYEGYLCDRKVNHCRDNPCKNGATCASIRNSFKCSCHPGYTGALCDQLEDNCAGTPCMHGYCKNEFLNFICSCDVGWQGPRCDIDVDECLHFPCENNGICSNSPGSFKCSCPSYYFGDYCEIPGTCIEKPCGIHGECIQLSQFTHSCNCLVGFTGETCDEQIDYCITLPCQNGGTCSSLIGAFNCSCLPGFSGETCQIDIDECESNACENGGLCIDLINGFDCNCNGTGYRGSRCTEDIDECALELCIHGACKNTEGSFVCDCEEGYIGKKCNVTNPCLPDSFNNSRHNCDHGECVRPTVLSLNGDDVAQYECDCEGGYTGFYCNHLDDKNRKASIISMAAPIIALIVAAILFATVLCAIIILRGHRGSQGSYSPSTEETMTSRLQMNSILKTPPEERLI